MSEQDEFAFFQGVQSANTVLNETMPDHAERVRNFYRHQGRTAAIDEVLMLITANQCFNFLKAEATKTDSCEHQGCHQLQGIRNKLMETHK